MSQSERRLIVVLGMHRSGTSAITSGLEALGVDLGESLMPPLANVNDKGFFEDVHVTQLNEELLKAIGSRWNSLSLVPEAALADEGLAPYKARAVALLRSKLGNRPYGLKDPRISRLLPFWQVVFSEVGASVSYVIVLRNPLSIAASLKKRDELAAEASHYLWLEHMIPAVLGTHGCQRVVVSFDSLMSGPKVQLARMATHLGLPFDEGSIAIKRYFEEFLDVDLQHSRFELEDMRSDPAVSEDVVKAYELLVGMSKDQPVAGDRLEIFRQLNERLHAMAPALDYMTRCQPDATMLKSLEELERRLAEVMAAKETAEAFAYERLEKIEALEEAKRIAEAFAYVRLEEIERLKDQLDAILSSRPYRIVRALGLAPEVRGPDA